MEQTWQPRQNFVEILLIQNQTGIVSSLYLLPLETPPPRTLIKNVICKIPTSHYLKSTLTLFTHAYYTKSFSALINYSDRQKTFRSIYPGIVIGLGDIEGNEEKPVLTLPWVVDFYLYISKGVSLPNHIHALKRKMTIQIHLPCRGEIKHIGLTCFRSFLTPFLENVKRFVTLRF